MGYTKEDVSRGLGDGRREREKGRERDWSPTFSLDFPEQRWMFLANLL